MKTMGLERLYLVDPRRFPDAEADARASGAADVLERAVICRSLDEALDGVGLAIALSARPRDLGPIALDSRAAGEAAVAEARRGEVAIVFGTELSGLTNDEVLRCQRIAHIDANPDYSSLNLAASVQVMAYEIRMAARTAPTVVERPVEHATHEDVERFYAHLEASLIASGFLNPDRPKRLMERLRRLFGRVHLEKEEVNILRGMLAAWDE
jgi:tRNA/rRNA methyltransferase